VWPENCADTLAAAVSAALLNGYARASRHMHFVSAKVIAGCFGLSAFAVAIIAGIAAGNSLAHVLMRALIATVVCYPIGVIVGLICARVISEHVERMMPQSPQHSNIGAGTAEEASDEGEQPIIV
jgi:hypothetical protein